MIQLQNTYDLTYFQDALKKLNLAFCDRQIDQFLIYYEMLTEKNKVMNLTAITKFDDVVQKHFIDSLLITSVWNIREQTGPNRKVLDVGTGAGFPGIPLKIAFPQMNIVLADSQNKRLQFLSEVISTLGLNHTDRSFVNKREYGMITVVHGRAEDLGRDAAYREQFDLCVSRAVSRLSVLCEYCLPFVKVGGTFIAYKSENVNQEIAQAQKAVQTLGGRIVRCEKIFLPGTDIIRSFVIIQKEKETGKKYPRKAGMPSRQPLE